MPRRRHRRRSVRLCSYDYTSAGPYFVTICTHERACLFGEVSDGVVQLNDLGNVVAEMWQGIPQHARGVVLDSWVVMPNHFHGIVALAASTTASKAKRGPAKSAYKAS